MFANSTANTTDSAHGAMPGSHDRAPGLGETSLLDPVVVFRTIWSFRWLIVATTILGIVLAVFVALATPKEYTAVSQVLVDPRDIKVVQNEVTPNGLPSEATLALIESQISVIYSNDLLDRVIDQAELTQDREFNGKAASPFAALAAYLPSVPAWLGTSSEEGEEAISDRQRLLTLQNLRRAMNVFRDAKSFVINIGVTTTDPEKSARLSTAISNAFVDQMGRVQSETARRASDALSSRLAELREQVSAAERAVEAYKSENRIVGVGGQLVDDNLITRINDELSRGRANLTALRVKAEQMRRASVDDVVQGSFPEALASETLGRLRSTYSDLDQQNSVLETTLGPRHPQLIASEEAVASARGAIRSELNRIIDATQTELARAENTNKDLTAQLDGLKNKQISTSESFVKLRELERVVDASRAVYEAFLLRARETGEQEQLNTANVRIISQATPPLDPSSMSRRTVVAAGGLLGLIFGIAIAVLVAVVRLFRALSRRGSLDVRPYPAPSMGGVAFDRWAGSDPSTIAASGHARGRFADQTGYGYGTAVTVAGTAGGGTGRRSTDELRGTETSLRLGAPAGGNDAEEPSDSRPQGSPPDGAAAGTGVALRDEDPTAAQEADERRRRRSTLRERVRAISAERYPEGRAAEEDPDVEKLQSDIAAVKAQIAAIRERRK